MKLIHCDEKHVGDRRRPSFISFRIEMDLGDDD